MSTIVFVAVGELDKQQVMIDVPQQRAGPEAPGLVVQVGDLYMLTCACGKGEGWDGGGGRVWGAPTVQGPNLGCLEWW